MHEHADPDELEPVLYASNGGGRLPPEPPVRDGEADLAQTVSKLQLANERLQRANRVLRHENTRLARGLLGTSDMAASAQLVRAERRLRPRVHELEAEVAELRLLLSTPRHQAVERLRARLMRARPAYWAVRRLRALLTRR